MYWEIVILAVILLFGMNYTGKISANRFVADNEVYFRKLKENDWDFYVKARYGDGVNPDFLLIIGLKKVLLLLSSCFVSLSLN